MWSRPHKTVTLERPNRPEQKTHPSRDWARGTQKCRNTNLNVTAKHLQGSLVRSEEDESAKADPAGPGHDPREDCGGAPVSSDVPDRGKDADFALAQHLSRLRDVER